MKLEQKREKRLEEKRPKAANAEEYLGPSTKKLRKNTFTSDLKIRLVGWLLGSKLHQRRETSCSIIQRSGQTATGCATSRR